MVCLYFSKIKPSRLKSWELKGNLTFSYIDSPYVEFGQIATAFYFSWFILIVPFIGILQNTLMDVATDKKKTKPSRT